MSVLSLEHVSVRHREGSREHAVLIDVDLELGESELVVIYGVRRSGRSTLLRIAAGIQAPDGGTVRFNGRDLAEHGEQTLGHGIGYVTKTLRAREEQAVLQQVASPLLARGVPLDRAQQAARAALARAGAQDTTAATVTELSAAETVRVALARTLTLSPAVIVIDEPVAAVELAERDGILASLRMLAAEGTAVLVSTGEPSELAGAHRALTLTDGQLRGSTSPQLAEVVAIRRGI
jgi:putative ABC transport system ATP-binding protein